jgi:N-acyl-D-amino-acid deacylase
VFDPQTILDTATFEEPTRPAAGIHYVLVNGRIALESGIPTGIRVGHVLLRNDPRA